MATKRNFKKEFTTIAKNIKDSLQSYNEIDEVQYKVKTTREWDACKANKRAVFNTMLEDVQEILEILNLVACDSDAINIKEWYRLKLEEVNY